MVFENRRKSILSLVRKTDYCWIWSGTDWGRGYGLFYMQHRRYSAHRASWILTFGDIPEGTACAVAKRLGRHYIGCDLKAEMVRVAKKRLENVE